MYSELCNLRASDHGLEELDLLRITRTVNAAGLEGVGALLWIWAVREALRLAARLKGDKSWGLPGRCGHRGSPVGVRPVWEDATRRSTGRQGLQRERVRACPIDYSERWGRLRL